MTDHKDNNNQYDPSLMDTQRLLLGVETPEVYDLDEIMAEFGSRGKQPEQDGPVSEDFSAPEPESPPEPVSAPKKDLPAETGPEPAEEERPDRASEASEAPEEPAAETPEESAAAPFSEEASAEGSEEELQEVSIEDMVASTVDAVKGEQEKRKERLRRQLEKLRRPERKKTSAVHQPLPEPEREPTSAEMAGRHKRQLRQCRRNLLPAAVVLILLWLPWIAVWSGTEVPFFSASGDNAALCVLIFQAIICFFCWPVYRMGVVSLGEGSWTVYATALLATGVTLLDEMTMMLLPGRTDAPPLGGVAACLSVFALWGLTAWHRGMAETFRIAAMGNPTRVADHTPHGAAKGRGGSRGFYTRAMMEDTSSQWQRLLLPVLAAASAVFALLASVGQERPQDFLWCWSAVLCAASSPVFLLAYCVPFGRVAARLARDGAALAGMYGASLLSEDLQLVVTDTDLFPQGSAALAGVKLYGEERGRAVSYAASLASQGGGLLGRVFEDACRSALVIPQNPEHFHIHEDGGFSGMLHGETVLLGTPSFMRRHGVRLPSSMPASKLAVCLAVDGTLTAAFNVRYTAAEPVEYALRILRRAGFRLTLATRDPNLTPRLLRARFGTDCGAQLPELEERMTLSSPDWQPEGPSGLLYRDGMLPYAYMVTGGRRLCQTVRVGNLISIFGSIAGALLAFYLTFVGSYGTLSPLLVLVFVLLWVVPMLPLVWTVDKA